MKTLNDKARKAVNLGREAKAEGKQLDDNPFQFAPAKLKYLASWWDKGYQEVTTLGEVDTKHQD